MTSQQHLLLSSSSNPEPSLSSARKRWPSPGALFLQLMRRPSTLIAGVLATPDLVDLFGALFANAPEGFARWHELWPLPWGWSDYLPRPSAVL